MHYRRSTDVFVCPFYDDWVWPWCDQETSRLSRNALFVFVCQILGLGPSQIWDFRCSTYLEWGALWLGHAENQRVALSYPCSCSGCGRLPSLCQWSCRWNLAQHQSQCLSSWSFSMFQAFPSSDALPPLYQSDPISTTMTFFQNSDKPQGLQYGGFASFADSGKRSGGPLHGRRASNWSADFRRPNQQQAIFKADLPTSKISFYLIDIPSDHILKTYVEDVWRFVPDHSLAYHIVT